MAPVITLRTALYGFYFDYQLTIFDYRVSFADPVAVRHSLEILSELATRDPYAVAMALGSLI